jgi:hypothetical protein
VELVSALGLHKMADIGDLAQSFTKGFSSTFDPSSAAKAQNQQLNTQFQLQRLMLQREAGQRAIKQGQRNEARLKIEQTRLGMDQASNMLGLVDKAREVSKVSPGNAMLYLQAGWRAFGIEINANTKEFFKMITQARTPEERKQIDEAMGVFVEEAGLNPQNFASTEFRDKFAEDPNAFILNLSNIQDERQKQKARDIVAQAVDQSPAAGGERPSLETLGEAAARRLLVAGDLDRAKEALKFRSAAVTQAVSPEGKQAQDLRNVIKDYGAGSATVKNLKKLLKAAGRPDFAGVRGLANDYLKQSGDFMKRRRFFKDLLISTSRGDVIGDIATVFSYMKMLDPTSVVNPGEQASVANAGNIPENIRTLYNRLLTTKGQMSKENRRRIVSLARGFYASSIETQEQTSKQFTSRAKDAGITPKEVVVDLVGKITPKIHVTDILDVDTRFVIRLGKLEDVPLSQIDPKKLNPSQRDALEKELEMRIILRTPIATGRSGGG